ncbi:MAG: SH3 domain-containing protein [Caldilinea sp.]|nr:SH3 domain-containing protein [Caldilinea sp.]MDW8439212.1 SH3 domain-containing protein [Caldilineaceae bacterium]
MRRLLLAVAAVSIVCIVLIGGVSMMSAFWAGPGANTPQSTANPLTPTNIVADEFSSTHDLTLLEPSEITSTEADSTGITYPLMENVSNAADLASDIEQSIGSAGVVSSNSEVAPFVVVLQDAFLYAGPDFGYERTGSLKAGNAVRVQACNPGCTWFRLDSNRWIPGEALGDPAVDLPVVDVEATPTAAAPAVFIWPTVTPTPLPTPTAAWSGPRAKEYTILRRGPGTIYERVGVVAPGAPLHVIAQNQAGDWYQLENGAWVAAFLLDKRPGELPVAVHIPPRPADARRLAVTFSSPWYACIQSVSAFANDEGENVQQWVYRSFRVTMTIENLDTTPVLPLYRPTRWIITDGVVDSVETVSWRAKDSRPAAHRQSILSYQDVSHPETWYVLSLQREQWVKAVEFEWNGEVHRVEYSPDEARNQQNYRDCGPSRSDPNG